MGSSWGLWRCSGIQKRILGKDNEHELIRAPRHANEDEVSALSERIGDLARGVVPTPQGWAVRVRKLDFPQASSIVDPDFAAEVGHDLMHMDPKESTHHYILKMCTFDDFHSTV